MLKEFGKSVRYSKEPRDELSDVDIVKTALDNFDFTKSLLEKNPHLAEALANSELGCLKITKRLGNFFEKISIDPPSFLALAPGGICYLSEMYDSIGISKLKYECVLLTLCIEKSSSDHHTVYQSIYS